MSDNEKKFGLLRGLSDIFVCEVKDSAEAYEPVGTPQRLIPAGELKITKTVDSTAIWYDDELFEEFKKEQPSEMEVIGAAIRAAFNAWLEGKDIDETTGAIMDDGDAHTKYFAISGKKGYTDGTSEYFWFLKCTYNGAEEATKTDDDSTDVTGMTLPFKAYKTQFKFANGNKRRKVMRIDTATTKIKEAASWTEQVVTPDNLGKITEKVIPA